MDQFQVAGTNESSRQRKRKEIEIKIVARKNSKRTKWKTWSRADFHAYTNTRRKPSKHAAFTHQQPAVWYLGSGSRQLSMDSGLPSSPHFLSSFSVLFGSKTVAISFSYSSLPLRYQVYSRARCPWRSILLYGVIAKNRVRPSSRHSGISDRPAPARDVYACVLRKVMNGTSRFQQPPDFQQKKHSVFFLKYCILHTSPHAAPYQ